jgi:SAM-dependent methyltransferase
MHTDHQCIICHASDFTAILRTGPWQYLRCRSCGLVCLWPRPGDQELLQNYAGYLPAGDKEIRQWEQMMRPVIRTSADMIEKKLAPHRGMLLDIGCGYGFFLHEMKSRGWDVAGIEISETGRRHAKNSFDISVYAEPIERLPFPESSFDVVTLFYVIEHIADPEALLFAVKRILKPGGLLLLRWPHSTPLVKILGPLSGGLDLYHTPYHLYDFSPQTIHKLLERAGFSDITTMIAGATLPPRPGPRMASWLFGSLGEILSSVSNGRLLLPGVSKTTLAVKRAG